jgi:cobalt-zinc-cadmium efflux system protein
VSAGIEILTVSDVHDHHHDHHHHAHDAPARRLILALLLTFCFALVEALGGLWSGSLALLGDAGHMFSDAVALGLAMLAAWVARRPPSARHSYGLARAEVVAALFNGLLMLAVIIGIVVEAIRRFQSPQPVPGLAVMVIAALGLFVNLLVLGVLSRGAHDLNTRGAVLHVIGDLLGSVAALIAGAVIFYTGWLPIDPLLSLLICVLILVSTLRLLRESLHVLMEGVPHHLDLEQVGRTLAGVPGVIAVHDLHIWAPDAGRPVLSAHIVVDSLGGWMDLLEKLEVLLETRFGIDHVTLQPETRAGRVRPVPMPRRSPPRHRAGP